MRYRPELDGLRGVAVLIVLGFHLNAGFRDSGNTGVTIFFVLSGFLITTLLLGERTEAGSIDLRGFYVRRARRLLPAFYVMLGVVTLLAVIHGTLATLAVPVLTAALYVSNIAAKFMDLGAVNHTWTLAIEEQFYLVWPLLILATNGRVARLTVLVPALIVMRAVGLEGYPAVTAGCILAVINAQRAIPPLPKILGALGVIALGFGTTGADTVIAGSLAVVAYLVSRPNRLLASAPLVAVGKISYGIYLWQIPVSHEVYRFTQALDWRWAVSVVVFSFVLAYISARFIEAPFRLPHQTFVMRIKPGMKLPTPPAPAPTVPVPVLTAKRTE